MSERIHAVKGGVTAAVSALLLAACGGGGGGADNIDEAVVFGDSLSDVGTYNPTTADGDPTTDVEGGLRFTTKPGVVWAEQVAFDYGLGLSIEPHWRVDFGVVGDGGRVVRNGGMGFAQGGARLVEDAPDGGVSAREVPGVGELPFQGATAISVRGQIDAYLDARNGFRDDQIVLIQGGANDFLGYLGRAAEDAALAEPEAVGEFVADAASAMVSQVQRLLSHGAENVVYANLPDLGGIPRLAGTPLAPLASSMSGAYNEAVAAALEGSDVVIFDLFTLLNRARERPVDFMLVNVEDPACNSVQPDTGDVSALFCGPETLVLPAADRNYLYADRLHPTARGHELWGQAATERALETIPK